MTPAMLETLTMRPNRCRSIGPQRGAADVERGCQVDGDDRVPVVVGESHREVVAVDPGVVDDDVETTERLPRSAPRGPRPPLGSARSAPSATAVAPWSARSDSTSASALSGCAEYPTATDAPARASAIAVALPMPRDAPVTSARRPSSGAGVAHPATSATSSCDAASSELTETARTAGCDALRETA